MHAVNFPEANIFLNKPADMTDAQCEGIPAYRSIDADGFPYTLVNMMPNKEDIEAINRGGAIALKIVGNAFPPFAMFTINENGEGNF